MNMRRWQFIAALLAPLGIARAQKPKDPLPKIDRITSEGGEPRFTVTQQSLTRTITVPNWVLGDAADNNQCPVCGQRADSYKRLRASTFYPCPPPASGGLACLKEDGEPYGPIERMVRCKRCNAAFWQDAE